MAGRFRSILAAVPLAALLLCTPRAGAGEATAQQVVQSAKERPWKKPGASPRQQRNGREAEGPDVRRVQERGGNAERRRPFEPPPSPAPERGRNDQDRARNAVREGQALPLSTIIRRVQGTCPGTFLNADLQQRGGALFYQVQMLSPEGRRTSLIVEAATGRIVGGGCR